MLSTAKPSSVLKSHLMSSGSGLVRTLCCNTGGCQCTAATGHKKSVSWEGAVGLGFLFFKTAFQKLGNTGDHDSNPPWEGLGMAAVPPPSAKSGS